ncbi:ribonuclease HII [uncultured Roseobacter sp.]|uniref:ribonuclease HII n=1 Tax=uncultured Roseobacter sp. TaxID=114847 RepID=UPI0026035D1B|nr:ribonuclease HII [uncultured Roseobacter sp.]
MMPDFEFEAAAYAAGALRVAGLDEVGRGPLAGPVTAAAVVLDPARIPEGLNDSKQIPAKKRVALAEALAEMAQVSVAHASVAEIETLNILQASHRAMRRAVAGLAMAPDHLLIDGSMLPKGMGAPAQGIVKGDTRCLSIAAASIIAKVTRDRLMVDLAQQHPGYGWETNMGYGSKSHISALQDLGVTPHHRRTFRPVHNILYQEKS